MSGRSTAAAWPATEGGLHLTGSWWGPRASPTPVDTRPPRAYNGTEFKACYKRFAAATRPTKGSAQCADLKEVTD